jgi:hypothetical protein
MTIEELEQSLRQCGATELVVQEGNLVTLKLAARSPGRGCPYIQETGDNLEAALRKTFRKARRVARKAEWK